MLKNLTDIVQDTSKICIQVTTARSGIWSGPLTQHQGLRGSQTMHIGWKRRMWVNSVPGDDFDDNYLLTLCKPSVEKQLYNTKSDIINSLWRPYNGRVVFFNISCFWHNFGALTVMSRVDMFLLNKYTSADNTTWLVLRVNNDLLP